MKIIQCKAKYEGEVFPQAWLAFGWMRNGSRSHRGQIRGAYVGVTLPRKEWEQWEAPLHSRPSAADERVTLRVSRMCEGYRRPFRVLAYRRNAHGIWHNWSRCDMREVA